MVSQQTDEEVPKKYDFKINSSTAATIVGTEIPITAEIKLNGNPVSGAKITLLDKDTGMTIASGKSDELGKAFLFVKVEKPKLIITGKADVP